MGKHIWVLFFLLVLPRQLGARIDVVDVAGALEARAQTLRKGVFTATHRRTALKAVDRSVIRSDDHRIFCAFDFDRNLFRFDRTSDTNFYSLHSFPQGPSEAFKKMVKPRMTLHWVLGPDDSIQATNYGDPNVSGIRIGRRSEQENIFLDAFDPRLIGFCDFNNLRSSRNSETVMNIIFTYLKKGQVEELPDGLLKIRVTSPLFQEFWIDISKNYAPVRMEEANPGPVVIDPKSLPSANMICTFDWMKINEHWVPAASRMEYRKARANEVELHEYSFEWKQVGEPVASVLFTPEGLGMPEKTPISDLRLGAGNSIAVGKLGPSAVPPDFNVPAETELGGGKGSRIIEVLIGLAVVAAVVGSVWYWRKRAGTRTG